MSTTQWKRVAEIFAAAAELAMDEQTRYLDKHCAGDAKLREEVTAMLVSHRRDDQFLTPLSPQELLAAGGIHYTAMPAGTAIGRYEIVNLIATGGMGEVYLARRADASFEQQVAIKVIRRSVATVGMLQRFNVERQALANLEHPNISRLIDGGTTEDGLPFLVMEYIQGLPIVAHCETNGLDLAQRLELFRSVCDAVRYAHQNLIVHRDIKPNNILVATDGTVKLLDFGIARLLNDDTDSETNAVATTITRTSALTPEYCSPEQVRGEAVTTATDVYSLGVVLYEMLTSSRPYGLRGMPRYEAERIICEEEPIAPSAAAGRRTDQTGAVIDGDDGADQTQPADSSLRWRRVLRGDLDNIVLKALQKEPSRRYASVEQLIDDLDRYAEGRPILARRDTFGYRAGKFVRRNRPQALAGAVMIVALLAAMTGVIVGLVQANRANRLVSEQRNAAEASRQQAQGAVDFLETMLGSASPFVRGRRASVEDLLNDAEALIASELSERPDVEANVRLALARTHRSLFKYTGAIPHLEKALAYYETAPGDHDLTIAECLALLGRSRSDLSFQSDVDPSGTVAMQERALAIRRAHFGDDHALIAQSLEDLALAHWAVGQPALASEEVVRGLNDSLAMCERLGLGETHQVADLHIAIGHALTRQKSVEAEQHFRTGVRIFEGLPGPSDQFALNGIQALAQLLRWTGRPAESLEVFELYRERAPREAALASTTNAFWQLLILRLRLEQGDQVEQALIEALQLECEVLRRDQPEWNARLLPPLNQLRLGVGQAGRQKTFSALLALLLEAGATWPARPAVPLGAIVSAMATLDSDENALDVVKQLLREAPDIVANDDPGRQRLLAVQNMLQQRADP